MHIDYWILYFISLKKKKRIESNDFSQFSTKKRKRKKIIKDAAGIWPSSKDDKNFDQDGLGIAYKHYYCGFF